MEPVSISIITPSLNQAGFIERAIRSVVEQDCRVAEHIIMDGGSTDGTTEVVQQFKSLSYLQWHSGPDSGQSNAINKGMRLATGSVVGWLNADDELFPGALHAIARAFSEHKHAGLIYGAGAKTDLDGRVTKEMPFREFDSRKFRSAFYILQPSMFFNRELFLKVGGLDESLHYAMDWDLVLRLEREAKIVAIPDKIGKLRCYPATKTSVGGWMRMREIAMIGRRHNGILDRNYLSYCVRNQAAKIQPFRKSVRRAVDFAASRLLPHGTCMIDSWPD